MEQVIWKGSFIPKYTPKHIFHRVNAIETTWALTFRGPWTNNWYEYDPINKQYIELCKGRTIIQMISI